MTLAARNFLASLNAVQKAKAQGKFDRADQERSFFNYVPAPDVLKTHKQPRPGLSLTEMTAPQRHLAHALLSTGLSQRGYAKAVTVMSLDDILRELEGDTSGRRNADSYFFKVYGDPSDAGVWGFRVEGHHLSVHFTVAGDKVGGSPTFFGSNPAEVRTGARAGLRTLAGEEDTGRALMEALTPEQRKVATVAEKAYSDILTSTKRKAALEGQPAGLAASKMTAKQRQLLTAILEEYAGNLPDDLAAYRMKQVKDAGTDLSFAWAGVVEKGGPHYYRVQAKAFLVEYDNTQNGANHVHCVWRDLKGDFAEDILAAHYAGGHSGGSK
jgi:hypothetical protein